MNAVIRFFTTTLPRAVGTFFSRFPELWIAALTTCIFLLLLPVKFWWVVFTVTVLLVGTFRRVREIPAVQRVLRFVERYQSYLGLILIFILGIVVCQINAPTDRDGNPYNPFLTARNQTNVLRQVSINGVLAVGMTGVILAAGIDLSVGAVLALCAVAAADLLRYYQWPVVAVIPAVLLLGFACGLTNGLLVTKARLQPFIATLAMFSMARGLAKYWGVWHGGGNQLIGLSPQEIIGGQTVHYDNIRQFLFLASNIGGGLKFQSVIFITVVALGIFTLNKTRFGRYIYAIGGNEEAARLSGINVTFVKNWVFAICGLLAGVAGLVYAADLQSGDPNAGFGFELDAIAAVVIGGTSLMGGVGGMVGTLLGALIIGYINNIMALKGLGSELQFILKGIIIVLAVMLQRSKKAG
ncbi:ABC transporter permease [bacterium]|nr:ABC transporter permease [bacterium]